MDRNATTGLVLMALLTVVYFAFFAPTPPPQPDRPAPSRSADTTAVQAIDSTTASVVTATTPSMTEAQQDSADQAQRQARYGDFSELTQGEAELIEVKTEKLTVQINTLGGKIDAAYLNEYKTYDSLPLPIVKPHPENAFYLRFLLDKTIPIETKDLIFTPSKAKLTVGKGDSAQLVLTAQIDEKRSLEQIYTFYGDQYDLGYEIRLKGMKEQLAGQTYLDLFWHSYLPRTELSIENMRPTTTIAYQLGDDVEKLNAVDEPQKETLNTGGINWVSFKSQFFSQILIAQQPLRSGVLNMRTPITDNINRYMSAKLRVDIDRSDDITKRFKMFMGPNEYTLLNSYGYDLEEEMDLGWWFISYINIGTTYVFKFLEGFVGNYGIIIIILALMIRTMVLPLTYKSYVSMAKMRVINQTPEMKELDEKHKGDAQKLQMAKMAIYKEMGVSMFGGCLPMLLSYPFLIALFFFFPQSVELRQQSFLWANDLSTYDSVLELPFNIPAYGSHVSLFCLLMAISTFFYTFYQQKSQPQASSNPVFKYIIYFMPVILLIFLNNYASGLSLYYLTSNLFSIASTLLIRRSINDEELLAQMRAAKKKGKKGKKNKGRLEKWVENQQKKQQQMMKERQQGKSNTRRTRRKK